MEIGYFLKLNYYNRKMDPIEITDIAQLVPVKFGKEIVQLSVMFNFLLRN